MSNWDWVSSNPLQLAEKSVKVLRGIIEEVLIKVDKFYYPMDFIVLDTEPVINVEIQIPVILGLPFLATTNALINCKTGVMKVSFGNMTLKLNIFDTSRHPFEYEGVKSVCSIEELVEEIVHESSSEDPLGKCLAACGGDMDLDTLLVHADALLDLAPDLEADIRETTETSSPDPSPSAAEPVK
jgi:hypothetical protein